MGPQHKPVPQPLQRAGEPSGLTTYVWPRMLTEMNRKKISTTVYITPEQGAQLKTLHEKTKVPVAEYIRQGIDLVLKQYGEVLPGQRSLFGS